MIMWEKRMYTSMCDWVTLLCSRKLTEHCKLTITEKIKKSLFKKLEAKKQFGCGDSCILYYEKYTSILRKNMDMKKSYCYNKAWLLSVSVDGRTKVSRNGQQVSYSKNMFFQRRKKLGVNKNNEMKCHIHLLMKHRYFLYEKEEDVGKENLNHCLKGKR